MLLDPRAYRLDDLLRRPLRATETWHQQGLRLALLASDEPVLPAEGLWRPSHISLFGREPFSELQVAQDSFIALDGTRVVSLLLRNPSSSSIPLEITAHWDMQGMHRCTPPLDDLFFQLAPDTTAHRVFTLSESSDGNAALKLTNKWYFESSPATTQARHLEDWQQQHAFLFDCSDPWLTRLVAHSQAPRWRGVNAPSAPKDGGDAKEWFPDGDFDAPLEEIACLAWDRWVVETLVGVSSDGETLNIRPDNAMGLSSFCLQGPHGCTVA
ncbi:hypothetical protein, partial [Armatimonas sp.]|uniref:hypothetical protein n=1 Tax=Armatimonas sp. TaxID=1872638 RepID=UPI00286A354E